MEKWEKNLVSFLLLNTCAVALWKVLPLPLVLWFKFLTLHFRNSWVGTSIVLWATLHYCPVLQPWSAFSKLLRGMKWGKQQNIVGRSGAIFLHPFISVLELLFLVGLCAQQSVSDFIRKNEKVTKGKKCMRVWLIGHFICLLLWSVLYHCKRVSLLFASRLNFPSLPAGCLLFLCPVRLSAVFIKTLPL